MCLRVPSAPPLPRSPVLMPFLDARLRQNATVLRQNITTDLPKPEQKLGAGPENSCHRRSTYPPDTSRANLKKVGRLNRAVIGVFSVQMR